MPEERKKCPFYEYHSCIHEACTLWSKPGNDCLISMALGTYILTNSAPILKMIDGIDAKQLKDYISKCPQGNLVSLPESKIIPLKGDVSIVAD